MACRALVLALCLALPAAGAEFVFENLDGPGEGLNDPAPADPVGGNPGTTVGAQRLAALARVGEIWGSFLVSAVPITATVKFDPLGTSTLAAAGPEDVEQNFANAPAPNLWYPVALANSLAGADLEPGAADIGITASSDANFYYGFDGPAPFGKSNFVDVLLHELGHGLGFISFVNLNGGAFPFGQVDIFSTYIYDNVRQAPWPALTAAQRVESAKSDPNLLWTGPFTTAGAPFVLTAVPGGFRLDAGRPDIAFVKAAFGGAIPPAGISGAVVVADDGADPPADACGPLVNSAEMAGNIALVRRGSCNFDDKVFYCQQAGAIAVILADNVDANLITPGGDGQIDGVPQNITIPAIFISQAEGNALETASPGAAASLTPLPPLLAGTKSGRLRLYAPPVLSQGSSVSHWTTDATPNLVMEPFISPVLDRKLDLGLTAMKDIGWQVIDIPFPYLTYDLWKSSEFPAGASQTGPNDDPDNDGITNFEEYFFGANPLAGDRGRLPVFVIEPGGPELAFTRSKLPTDVNYTLEKSTNLVAFAPALEGTDYTIVSVQPLGTDAERVVLRLAGMGEKLFLRLRISGK